MGLRLEPLVEAPACTHCGHPEFVELHEVWGPREFMLETCCEGMNAAANDFLAEDPRGAGRWLGDTLGLNAALAGLHGCGSGVRRVIEANGQVVLDWNLQVVSVAWGTAKAFVRDHHRHCKPPAGWRFGAAAMNGADIIGVITVGRPVSRKLDQHRMVEVNRLCVREDLADGLEWNACSMLYGWARREARTRGFEHILTYTLASESGVALKAAGWTQGHRVKGRRWNSPSRPRGDNTPVEDKVCWYSTLVKQPVSALPRPRLAAAAPTPIRSTAATPALLAA